MRVKSYLSTIVSAYEITKELRGVEGDRRGPRRVVEGCRGSWEVVGGSG